MKRSRSFRPLSLGETVEQTDVLFVAPNCLQNKVLDRIDREIKLTKEGKKGYLGFKLNSLTDKRIIDKLIEASQAGVQIDMVVRGICCLQPGIPGYTDHIRIISIVGRYLEHSRIYIFGTGDREEIYISSADFMTRNTLRRVEVSVPIFNSKLREELKEMFGLMLSDNVKARELGCRRHLPQSLDRRYAAQFPGSPVSDCLRLCPDRERRGLTWSMSWKTYFRSPLWKRF